MTDPITDFIKLAWTGIIGGFIVAPQARDIADDTKRALGVDPSTGKTIGPYSPGAGVDAQAQAAANQYVAGYVQNYQAMGGNSVLPFSPVVGGDAKVFDALGAALWPFGGNDSPDGSRPNPTSSPLLWFLVVLVIAFLVLKVVK
jgi:hypothetical protein